MSIININDFADGFSDGAGAFLPERSRKKPRSYLEMHSEKLLDSIDEAIRRTGLRDGMTISFHHHFRNGDHVLNMVMEAVARCGIKDLTVAASSLLDIHKPLIGHIKNGTVRKLETSGLRGELGEAVSRGLMAEPVVFRSHGGRAYAIEKDRLHIDVAFLGAPSCDSFGNANGYSRDKEGAVICGSLGYAKCDAEYADKVVILTDNIVPFPNAPFAIPESQVDYIVEVPSIGDPNGIMSGATRYTKNPKELLIAECAAAVIENSGYFRDGFSMQMGTGGASLATARFLREKMLSAGIQAGFALGGITGQMVQLFNDGLIRRILDVQSFDLDAARSLRDNRFHQQISANYYASPGNGGAAVDQLDVVVLSALEVDRDFNVNVLTGSDGVIRGAIGGHCDTAAGAAVSIVVTPLIRGRIASVTERVNTVVTPGNTVDVVVTDQGIAVNPQRPELRDRLAAAGLPVQDIASLSARAGKLVGCPAPIRYTDRVVGVVTYRDGSVIDLVRQVGE